MATVCKITLDAAEYKKELDDVVARSKEAQAKLSGGIGSAGTPSAGIGLEAQQQVRINAESNVPEVAQEAREALDGIENAEPAITAASDVPQAAEAAENAIQGIPDANVTVTANADPRPIEVVEEHLRNLPNDRRVTVTVDADTRSLEYIPRSLQRVERGANTAGRAANSLGGEISKAGGIVSAFGGKAGGLFGGLGQMIEALSSPVAMLTTAFGALATIALSFFSRSAEKAREAAEMMQRNGDSIREAATAAEEQRRKNESNWQSLQKLKTSLDALSVTEKASNAQKLEAKRLIDELRKSYSGLSISIDETTGKVKGFDRAYSGVLEKNRKDRLREINAQLNSNRSEIDVLTQERDNAGISGWWLLGLPQLLKWDRNTRIGGEQTVKEADARIQELNKMNAELNRERVRLEKSNPAEDYTKKAQAEEMDRKQQTFDAAHDQLKDEQRKLEYLKLINEGRIKEANALKLINEAKKQGMELEKSDAEWIAERQGKVRMDTYYETEMDSLATKKREQELINQRLDEEAEKLRLIMELEKQGAEVSDDQVEKIMRKRRELKSLKLTGSLKEQIEDIQYQSMRKIGFSREADEQKALRDAERTKGGSLTGEETELVKSITTLTYQLAHVTQPQLGDLSIRSNSLTARGGFSSGAVLPDKDAVNKVIAKFTEKECQLLEKIQALSEKINATIERNGKV